MNRYWVALFGWFIIGGAPVNAQEIEIKGLFKGGVFVQYEGKGRLLKQGQALNSFVYLVEADSRGALFNINGQQKMLHLSQRIGADYALPPVNKVVLHAQHNAFKSPGQINDMPVQFVVDTGATHVILSVEQADKLNIDYRNAIILSLQTANGLVDGHQVLLDEVTVGDITLTHVSAIVADAPIGDNILLGNSFLKQLEYRVKDNVLVMQGHGRYL